jgi:hypothetical protein
MTDQNQLLREALRVARDHIDMHSLEVSHCKDAALIRAALSHPAQPASAQPQGAGEAVAAQAKFKCGEVWGWCSIEHHHEVQAKPTEWANYETRLLYTTPPASQQSAQAVPTKPLFASAVAARKWEELQEQGHRMQLIQFDGGPGGPGTIGPWGVVMWGEPLPAAQAVPDVDPLQGAASWLATALVDCKTADIQQRLAIGYNRADRLLRAAKGEQ